MYKNIIFLTFVPRYCTALTQKIIPMYLHRFFFYLQLSKVFYCFTESYRSQSFIWVMAPDTYERQILQQVLEQQEHYYYIGS